MSRLLKTIRAVFYYGFQPLFFFIVFIAWWWTPGRADAPLLIAMGLLVVANLAIYALELLVPDLPDWVATPTDRKIDAFYLVTRVVLWGPVFQILALLAIMPAIEAAEIPSVWPTDWPVAVTIALALVIAEAIAYVLHIAHHRWMPLWRIHSTHHAQSKLTSARWSAIHPIEIALVQLPIFLVAALLGPQEIDIAGAVVIGRSTTILAHSNLRLSPSGLGLIFTTTEHHRYHHDQDPDRIANYADVLIVFDRLFGTFSRERSTAVGLRSQQELTLREQLLLPARPEWLLAEPPEQLPPEPVIDLTDKPSHRAQDPQPTN